MRLRMCFGIPWEVPQKVSEFSDSQKMLFWTVIYPNMRCKILRNSLGGGKFSLKIRVTSFMLIRRSNKFQDIPIARRTRTYKNPQQSTKFKNYGGVDQWIGSIQKWNKVKNMSFLTPLHLLKSLGQLFFSKKSNSKSWVFNLF